MFKSFIPFVSLSLLLLLSGRAGTDFVRPNPDALVKGFKFFRKALLVSFDERGVVSDVEFSTSGSK